MKPTTTHPKVSARTREAANRRFESLLPELESRCKRIATRYPRNMRRDVADDALSFCYRNHLSCFVRGKRPTAGDLAFYAVHHVRHRSMVTQRAYPSRVRHRLLCLDEVTPDPGTTVGRALTTDVRADPAERVRISHDWRVFANSRNRRTQHILHGLSIGDSKSGIAAKLGISRGRLSQLLDVVAGEVTEFFDGDVGVPSEARRAGRC